jgi:hypothetical protein
MFARECISLLLYLTKPRIINCPTKYATDIKVKTAIIPELRLKLGDNSSEVLASEASVMNAIATIKQTMNIILFDSIE